MNYFINNENIRYWFFVISLAISAFASYFLSDFIESYIQQDLLRFGILFIFSLIFGYVLIYKSFSKIFFKIPVLKNIIPNFSGTWTGIAKSSFQNKQIDVRMEVKQDLRTISVNCYFNQSKSEAKSVYVEKNNNKEKLYYVYLNEPNNIEKNLDCHYGTIILEKIDSNILKGNYFTNRKYQTKGTFQLTKKQ